MTKQEKTDELSLLLPDREVVIGSETLIVREYTLKDIMQLSVAIDGFVTPLAELLGKREILEYDEVEQFITAHYESVLPLIACAINKPLDYVSNLSSKYYFILIDTWWIVNCDFFIKAAARKIHQQATQEKAKASRNGGESLPNLSGADTAKTT